MRFYHATTNEVMEKILRDKEIKQSWDGCVYLCKQPIDSCKFLAIRGIRKVCVIEVELGNDEVQESHDHSESFFGCKAYIHEGGIELTGKERTEEYEFEF